ncbi:hypothetical protein D3C81_1699160 [compost metagenome]
MVDLGAAVGGEGELADLVGAAFGFELFFGLADGGQFRAGIDDAGDKVVVDLMGLAGNALDARYRFILGLVREHRARGDVADYPDAGHRTAVVIVAQHAALVGRQAHAFQVQALGVRATTDGYQHVVGLQGLCVATGGRLQGQADAVG